MKKNLKWTMKSKAINQNKLFRMMHKSLFVFAFLLPLLSIGQDTNKIYNETLVIRMKYIPKLTDAIKLDIIPVNEKAEVVRPQITYRVKSTLFPVEQETLEKLPALKFKSPRRTKLDHYYLKAGFGNYNQLLVEGVFNTTKLRDRSLSIHALHNSGKSTVKYSNVSEQLLEINGHVDFRKNTLSAGVYIDNNRHHHYGFSSSDSVNFDTLNADMIRQNFLDAGFKLKFTNELSRRNNIRYWTQLTFYNFSDYFRLNETGISFNGKIEQYFRNNPIRFEATVNQYFINSNPGLSRTYFDINAKYLFIRDNWVAEIGFDAPTEIDTIGSKTHFYPIAKIEGRLASNFVYGFAGINGGLMENTYKSVASYNPFVASNFSLRNTNNKFELFAGLKGSVHEKFRYKTSISYHNMENLLLFVNDATHTERFLTVYDSSNTNLIKLHGEIEMNVIKDLLLFASVNYYNYDQSPPEELPWHLPDLDFKFSAKYHIQNKIYFNLDYFILGKRYAKVWPDSLILNPDPILLQAVNDLNFGITYKFSDKFGLFFQFNNILNNKYSYWNNYSLRGFHFIAGLKLNL